MIRPWLPESPKWLAQRMAGTLRRPSILELFSPALRRTTIVSTIMVAAVYGAAFGAIQMIPQLMAGVPQVKQNVGKAIAAAKKTPEWQAKVAKAAKPEDLKKLEGLLAKQTGAPIEQAAVASMSKVQELGGLAGRVLLAVLAVYVVSRQRLIRIFQIPALLVMPVVFGWCAVTDLHYLYVGIFFAGLLTVGQFSFWGNYLPRVYPVHLRGTGESFAANVGGRLIGTSFFAVTQWLAPMLPVKGPVAPEHKL
ncbi:MAG: MFS transporter, partial [Planctomycetia bacterium]|nr:MFS transporter [Planctomycetia bacterium]